MPNRVRMAGDNMPEAQPMNRVYPKPVVALRQVQGQSDSSFSARELFPGMSFLLVNHYGKDAYTIERSCGIYFCQQGGCMLHGAYRDTPLQVREIRFVGPEAGPITLMFPEGEFCGMVLQVDLSRIPQDLRMVLRTCFDVGIDELMQKLPSGEMDGVLRENPTATHVLSELFVLAPKADRAYLRVKAFELLTLLTHQGRLGGASTHESATLRTADRHIAIAYKAYNEMTCDLTRQLTITELAQRCGTSPTVLKEAFKESFGMPIYSWFRAYRMQKACELLSSDSHRSVASISAEVGYANPSKFAKAFSDYTGKTPRAWRATQVDAAKGA